MLRRRLQRNKLQRMLRLRQLQLPSKLPPKRLLPKLLAQSKHWPKQLPSALQQARGTQRVRRWLPQLLLCISPSSLLLLSLALQGPLLAWHCLSRKGAEGLRKIEMLRSHLRRPYLLLRFLPIRLRPRRSSWPRSRYKRCLSQRHCRLLLQLLCKQP